jgi:hypothetical protein
MAKSRQKYDYRPSGDEVIPEVPSPTADADELSQLNSNAIENEDEILRRGEKTIDK